MQLKHLSPILWTKNLEESITFYTQVLGFTSQSNFPNFTSLSRDAVEIMMIVPTDPEECDEAGISQPFFAQPKLTGSIFIVTENVDDLWEQVKGKATILSPIADREYMMRDFSIADNNGYELVFGEDISRQGNGRP